MDTAEISFKKKGFGLLKKERLVASYNLKPDTERLRAPLLEGAGLRTFCNACGTYHEVKAEYIQELASILGVNISPDEHYYESQACIACDSNKAGGVFKRIDDGSVVDTFNT